VSVAPRDSGSCPGSADDADNSGLTLEGVRVLVVDDDFDARELLKTVLGHRGATVLVAANASEAFDAIVAERPDVLVPDIAMPDEDGYTLIRRIRTLAAADGGGTPAIAVTAYTAATDRARALEAGFDRFLPKPVDLGKLVAFIDELLSGELRVA
jgi:CheY-like chemotaxis protein